MDNDLLKLKTLCELEGFEEPAELAETAIFDSVSPGICMNAGCDYTTNVEPDSDQGWCECCDTNTVKSGLMLFGVM